MKRDVGRSMPFEISLWFLGAALTMLWRAQHKCASQPRAPGGVQARVQAHQLAERLCSSQKRALAPQRRRRRARHRWRRRRRRRVVRQRGLCDGLAHQLVAARGRHHRRDSGRATGHQPASRRRRHALRQCVVVIVISACCRRPHEPPWRPLRLVVTRAPAHGCPPVRPRRKAPLRRRARRNAGLLRAARARRAERPRNALPEQMGRTLPLLSWLSYEVVRM